MSQKAIITNRRLRYNRATGPGTLRSHPIHLRIGFVGLQLVFALVVVVEVAASLLRRRGSDVVVWSDLGSSEIHQILQYTAGTVQRLLSRTASVDRIIPYVLV